MPIVGCGICDKNFYVKPSHQKLGWGKYCSLECRSKSQLKGKFFNCLVCKKEFYRSPSKIKHSKSGNFFCSKACHMGWKNSQAIEERHPNWSGGTQAYRNILKRSGRKRYCTGCKISDKRVLVVHHIDQNRKNNDLSNLAWLCQNCHHLIHYHKNFKIKFD